MCRNYVFKALFPFSGVDLEFEKTLYTFEEGHKDLEIVIMSSRQLGEYELKKCLKFEPEEILTMNGNFLLQKFVKM